MKKSKKDIQFEKMIDFALANGINYFDTAWIYHGGNSEIAAGKYLTRYPREKYLLATKYPAMVPEALTDVPHIFETQMKRCSCGYFDFYLLHNVNENTIEYYLDEEKTKAAWHDGYYHTGDTAWKDEDSRKG